MSITLLHPLALWLILPGVTLIVFFRLLRNRRQTIDVGSLLIWKKLAALSKPPQKRKFVFDTSLALQALALIAVLAALASPLVLPSAKPGRSIFLMIDNGPLSRARTADGSPYFKELFASARSVLLNLGKDDRVVVACSSPFPKLIDLNPMSGQDAATMVANRERTLSPALSGPDAAAIRGFALDRVRAIFPNGSAKTVVVSMQSDSEQHPENTSTLFWMKSPHLNANFDNAGIVACGSRATSAQTRQILVRVANFSDKEMRGPLSASVQAQGVLRPMSSQPITLSAHGDAAATFDIPNGINESILVKLNPETGFNDALPEDNTVRLTPRATHKPTVRFHSRLPVLERFFQSALDAKIVNAIETESTDAPDLDVFVGSVPENLAADVRAALFVAPSKGYHSYFDVSEKSFAWPNVRRGDDDPLNADIPAADTGIAIPKAYEILRTGDFKTLLQDTDSQRALALKFSDEHARLCVALAFVPNDGMALERLLDPPLAALLARVALQASQSGEPYVVVKASEVEARTGEPLALNWSPNGSADVIVSGVLDERTSNLKAAESATVAGKSSSDMQAFMAPKETQAASFADLMPWLAVVGGAAAVVEILMVSQAASKRET